MNNIKNNYIAKISRMIPKGALYITEHFEKYYNCDSYIVGGCVRDILLNKKPNDWDICTKATPTQMLDMIDQLNNYQEKMKQESEQSGMDMYLGATLKAIPTGIQHGTITINVAYGNRNEFYETTTFRHDGNYSDGRRPDKVTFTDDLIEDLARRDFTMNAIAFNRFKGFIDPFNGIGDIGNKLIRCVGNPDERFNEDGLRILRAIRFAAQLGFTIEKETAKAIHNNKHLLSNISKERIQSELCKILLSPYCGNKVLREYADVISYCIPEIEPMIGFKQNNPYHLHDVWEHTLSCMVAMTPTFSAMPSYDIITRLAVLLHDIGKPYTYSIDAENIGHFYGHAKKSAEISHKILTDLKFSNDIIEKTLQLITYHDAELLSSKASVKRWLNKLGQEQFERLIALKRLDYCGQNANFYIPRVMHLLSVKRTLVGVIKENECFKLKDLAINGKDLIQHGIPQGKLIGQILDELLIMVIDGEIKNEKDELLKMTDLILLQKKIK